MSSPIAAETADQSDAPQAGRTVPASVLASAKALEEAGDAAGARSLLMGFRPRWHRVPPVYDAEIGRLSLALGDGMAAVENLSNAIFMRGSAAPLQWRRFLGNALLLQGRILEAGREFNAMSAGSAVVSRRAAAAALAAFHEAEAGGTEAVPSRSLAEAELLAEAAQTTEAYALLLLHRGNWQAVPPPYDAALGRLALMNKAWENAADCLRRALAGWKGPVPVSLRRELGSALLAIGRFDEAGRELSLALDEGATITETVPRVAINAYRAANGAGARLGTSFGRSLTFVDRERGLAYCSIPKNGSSVLKANLVMNSNLRADYLGSGQSVHDFAIKLNPRLSPLDDVMGKAWFRFVVLRDPLRRLVSAYLNRVVGIRNDADPFAALQLARTVREAQAVLSIPHDDARSITFEEFVRYLSRVPDVHCDIHWMPQVIIAGGDLSVFGHVGKVEALDGTLDMLASRFGYQVERDIVAHMPRGTVHLTRYSETSALVQPYRALPAELDQYTDDMPVPDLFYTPELRELAERRYAADMALYAAA